MIDIHKTYVTKQSNFPVTITQIDTSLSGFAVFGSFVNQDGTTIPYAWRQDGSVYANQSNPMDLIEPPNFNLIKQTKKVTYFSIQFDVPVNVTNITTNADGSVVTHTNTPTIQGSQWISQNATKIDTYQFTGDWTQSLKEI